VVSGNLRSRSASNNKKTWETKEKSIRKAFLFKTLVKNCFAEKYLVFFDGSVLFSLLCVYYFCTIFVIHPKNWRRYHPLVHNNICVSSVFFTSIKGYYTALVALRSQKCFDVNSRPVCRLKMTTATCD
jgi:hypothetical protein